MVQVKMGYIQLINQLNEFEITHFGVPQTELHIDAVYWPSMIQNWNPNRLRVSFVTQSQW